MDEMETLLRAARAISRSWPPIAVGRATKASKITLPSGEVVLLSATYQDPAAVVRSILALRTVNEQIHNLRERSAPSSNVRAAAGIITLIMGGTRARLAAR